MNKDTLVRLGEWAAVTDQLASLKAYESALRKEIFTALFPTPCEGTNTVALPEGWRAKGTYVLNRTLDEAALPAVLEKLRSMQAPVDLLVTYPPKLSVSTYRKLDAKAQRILEQAMETKPGMPGLELIAPKE